MVRYVDTETASVWMELTAPAAVLLSVKPLVAAKARPPKVKEHAVWSVQVGGRHYALAYVTGLRPGTWYTYGIELAELTGDSPRRYPTTPDRIRCYESYRRERLGRLAIGKGPTLRTLDEKGRKPLRIAFGSCRKHGGGQREKKGVDAFQALGGWLQETEADRLTRWPQLLLLVGDQIYADDVSPTAMATVMKRRQPGAEPPLSLDEVKTSPIRKAGIHGSQLIAYEELAELYNFSWFDAAAQKVLANVPTFMQLDDHEVTDDWNITGMWVQQMLAVPGWVSTVADAMAAYWMYQGWGNLHPERDASDPRVKLLREHAARGEDALPALRALLGQKLYAKPADRLPWHYRIDSSPPIFVVDDRADRELFPPFQESGKWIYASPDDRIVSRHQLAKLGEQLAGVDEPVLLATSIPLIHPQPLLTGMLWFARTIIDVFHVLELGHSEEWEDMRREQDIEGWFAFPRGLGDLMDLVDAMRARGQKQPLVFLSGDVHFAYAMWMRFTTPGNPDGHPILQLVSSPLFNALTRDDREALREVVEDGFPLGKNIRLGMGAVNPAIQARRDRKLIPGFDDLASRLELVLETIAAATGTATFPKGIVGPRFTKIEDPPASSPDVVEAEILFENNVCFVDVSRDRKLLEARWLVPDPVKKTTLVLAATLRKSLVPS